MEFIFNSGEWAIIRIWVIIRMNTVFFLPTFFVHKIQFINFQFSDIVTILITINIQINAIHFFYN